MKDEGSGKKLARDRTMGDILQGRTVKEPQSILSVTAFRQYLAAQPALRRWFLARVFGESGESAYVDLTYSPVTQDGLQQLSGLDPASLRSLPKESLEWWGEENEDLVVHLPLAAFRQFLEETSAYPTGEPLVEGMVFIELWKAGEPQFVPFSYQARESGKQVYDRLMKNQDEGG